jgi:hypothetical protein
MSYHKYVSFFLHALGQNHYYFTVNRLEYFDPIVPRFSQRRCLSEDGAHQKVSYCRCRGYKKNHDLQKYLYVHRHQICSECQMYIYTHLPGYHSLSIGRIYWQNVDVSSLYRSRPVVYHRWVLNGEPHNMGGTATATPFLQPPLLRTVRNRGAPCSFRPCLAEVYLGVFGGVFLRVLGEYTSVTQFTPLTLYSLHQNTLHPSLSFGTERINLAEFRDRIWTQIMHANDMLQHYVHQLHSNNKICCNNLS